MDKHITRVLQGTPEARGPITDPHELAKVREGVQGYIDQYKQLQGEKVCLARSLYESIETQVRYAVWIQNANTITACCEVTCSIADINSPTQLRHPACNLVGLDIDLLLREPACGGMEYQQ